jgi:hypothetical protein
MFTTNPTRIRPSRWEAVDRRCEYFLTETITQKLVGLSRGHVKKSHITIKELGLVSQTVKS